MRSSKSNPSKFVRHYKSLSQRRMTDHDDQDDDAEMERWRTLLRESQQHLAGQTTGGNDDGENQEKEDGRTRKQGRKRPRNETKSPEREDSKDATDEQKDAADLGPENELAQILDPDMLEEIGQGDLLLGSKKKKKSTQKAAVYLSPQEIKQARQLQKNALRKIKQLEVRAEQKSKRQSCYAQLQSTALSPSAQKLLSSSSTLGQRLTQRRTLQKLLAKERAGLALTESERDLLYRDRPEVFNPPPIDADPASQASHAPLDTTNSIESAPLDPERNNSKRTRGCKKEDKDNHRPKGSQQEETTPLDSDGGISRFLPISETKSTTNNSEVEMHQIDPVHDTAAEEPSVSSSSKEHESSPFSAAAQLMASLTQLKQSSTIQAEKLAREREEEERQRQEEEEQRLVNQKKQRYIPVESAILKSAATLGLQVQPLDTNRKVRSISRPNSLVATRNDLPVVTMEYEVVDTIRNHDITIICAETGSGKSTQVPQFCYESGLSFSQAEMDGECRMVGVTQPRRVAAISTAKRVAYEMGLGDGRSIPRGKPGEGCEVAYQTRYETAGLGAKTHIKFMTDGILLQEIQSDLLLRKYSVIVLDEAHERNLNTDVLIGLLSAALPLRKQASEEEGSKMAPLKIVIMSATLRVEDFTGNKSLFSGSSLAQIKIPGRTFPVTIHHSKVTEIDSYEESAFKKTCKIHRKLPQGGILVFLTGQREIVRMVKKLRHALNPRNERLLDKLNQDLDWNPSHDQSEPETAPRDMDDDEVDGDIAAKDEEDDIIENDEQIEESNNVDNEDGRPKKVLVLPLFAMLSAEAQAKVFLPVPDGYRLIVVATNIAETSITIPGISYVVDSGRQKCRNYNTTTGVASFDITWISKASADQRAGRSGRCGPGHCYRLYSSSLYSRHMDPFALPEVLCRPLEDVVLAMKAMKIGDVGRFPFPTPPDKSQIQAAVRVLSSIGCVDVSKVEVVGGDGEATRLGRAVAKLPLGVRTGKILLVASEAGVLDYASVIVAALSEVSPFQPTMRGVDLPQEECSDDVSDDTPKDEELRKSKPHGWSHKGGDMIAILLAVGAYTFAGRGAGGASERMACRKFCDDNGLNPVVMERIQKMRSHIIRIAMTRLGHTVAESASRGEIVPVMKPPNQFQEHLLRQAILSGLLDNVAMLAPPGAIPGTHPVSFRAAYMGCSSSMKEPLYLDRNSVIFSRDRRMVPEWICFESLIRKSLKDGTQIAVMKNITPIESSWLGQVGTGSYLLKIGDPVAIPPPKYDASRDKVMCSAKTTFGSHNWEVAPVQVEMLIAVTPSCKDFTVDDVFRWFGRFLLEGKVFPELAPLAGMLNDSPTLLTRRTSVKKVSLLVNALSTKNIDSSRSLQKYWAEINSNYLFVHVRSWLKAESSKAAKDIWLAMVKHRVAEWKMAMAASTGV